MSRALDAIAEAVSDDVYITETKDLELILNNPKGSRSLQAFENAQFNGKKFEHKT